MTAFRTLSLAIACLALAAVTIHTTLHPKDKQPHYKAFTFPNTVPLNQWQSIPTQNAAKHPLNNLLFATLSSADLSSSATFSGEIAAHQQYHYRKDNQHLPTQHLTINIRYLVNTNGNLKALIEEETHQSNAPIQQSTLQQSTLQHNTLQQESTTNKGYSLISHEGYAYLNTCQNSRGAATLTTDQFNRNRLIHDLQPSRLWPWLQGKDTLPDQRCLWTQISVPLSGYESDSEAYAVLEAAWADWSNWWQPNFPIN